MTPPRATSSGFSLAIVIVVMTVISISVVILMRQLSSANKIATRIGKELQQKNHQSNQICREILRMRDRHQVLIENDTKELDIPDLSRDIWTLHFDSKIITDSSLSPVIGYSADDLFPFALSIENKDVPLVFADQVYIDYDVQLSDTSYQFSHPRMKKSDVIRGYVIHRDEGVTTRVSPQLVALYKSQFSNHLNRTTLKLSSGGADDVWFEDLPIYPSVYALDGDVGGELKLNSQDNLDTLIATGTIRLTGKSSIDKPLVLIAGEDVYITDSTMASDLIVYSEGSIFLQRQAQVLGTFISESSILLADQSSCIFPSNLIVMKNDNKLFTEPEIALKGNASVEGLLIVYGEDESDGNRLRKHTSARILKTRESKLFGGLYCDGVAEIYGVVKGFVSVQRIEQRKGGTRWLNYLDDIQILRKDIGPEFPIPPIFDLTVNLKLLGV